MKLFWRKWNSGWLYRDTIEFKPRPTLVEMVEQAKQEWLYAKKYYDEVSDQDLVEYAVYLIKAYERKYIYLLKRARQEAVIADSTHYIVDCNK